MSKVTPRTSAPHLDESNQLERGDLLVGLDVEMYAEVLERGGQCVDEPGCGVELVLPRHVCAEPVAGIHPGNPELVVARVGPRLPDVDGSACLDHLQ
ncbi:hypothetical protein [Nocardioides kongjuensis]|uniref:Uncharacterized protein n=1 Tax=Nocardioides kongjuensis TaxID=349522 RepID=A0A852RWP9_9ACTN|nr:hypothetical protein [Nocardioides kongjuensis]NYD33290.1 hypothetical protein [Nocardioides kongjuensis]